MTARDIRVPVLMNAEEYLAFSEQCETSGTNRGTQLRKMANKWVKYKREQKKREDIQHAHVMPMFLPPRVNYIARMRV